jgi:hypothetical protein
MNKQQWYRGGGLLLMLLFLTTALPLKADDDDDDKRDRYEKTRKYQRSTKDSTKNSTKISATETQSLSIQSGLQISPTSVVMSKGSSAYITVTNPYGSVRVESHETSIVRAYYDSENSRVILSARGTGKTELTIRDRRSELKVPVTVLSESTPPPPPPEPPTASGDFTLLAWNDLGMHCVDGKDYSVFSILPPYNNLIAQLLDKNGGLVTEGVELTYEALGSTIKDSEGNDITSINTYSAPTEVGQIEKTNFWDYVLKLFGGDPEPNHGLNLNNPNISNRTPGTEPLPMEFNVGMNWFQAEGLPITPIDDNGNKNFYPMVKVTALDGQGNVLAMTKTVLPVSDEMTCKSCHSSTNDPSPLANAAKPATGWEFDSDAEKDWKFNILKKHDDELNGVKATLYRDALAAKGFAAAGLYPTATDATNATPVLCASCHGSNALGTQSYPGVQPLTQALHGSHAKVSDPVSGIALNDSANRDSCYLCHPGSETQCLRGAMGNAKDDQGNSAMSCQSCHGDMEAVGSPERQGWFEEPTCQSCHHDGQRLTSSLDANGNLIVPQDKTFASNADTPAPGLDLYRFSTGHGDLQCESCHGATHAVYPSSHEEDNLQSIELQGHAGTVNECTACHTNVPMTTSGGPHGMHTIGEAWIDRHEDVAERNTQSCAYCHGSDYRGSPLSEIKVSKTFRVEGRNKTFAAGHQSNCYDCHNGPDGD